MDCGGPPVYPQFTPSASRGRAHVFLQYQRRQSRTVNLPIEACVVEDMHTIIGCLCLLAIVGVLHWAFPNSRLGIEFVAAILAIFL